MTDRYAVFGNPISHSKSPEIHTAFAAATGQDLSYQAIQAPVDGFAQALATFVRDGGMGCNVTAPFKLDALAAADQASPSAQLAGAANCLTMRDGRLHADNFDGVGLLADIQDNLGISLAGKRVLLLGAGGATRGVLLPLLQAAPAQITIANRTDAKAEDLAESFADRGPVSGCGFAALTEARFDVVVNGTSASLSADRLPLPASVFAPGCLAYEMVYGKGRTPFLVQAQEAGARRVADGVGMLVEQAAAAFHLWRGVKPETAPQIARLSVPLE